ncbi:MAG: hypothetical protein ABSF29_02855 [Tepidisphaeraceae bacterium]
MTLDFDGVTNPISGDYAALFSSGLSTFQGYLTLAPIPAGDSSQKFIISPAADSQSNPADANDTAAITSFALVGVYTNSDSGQGLSLGVNDTDASAAEGLTYSEVFAGAPLTEAQLDADLLNPPAGAANLILENDLNTSISFGAGPGILLGGTGDIVDFSSGTLNGAVGGAASTAVVGGGPSAVPLPSAAWMGLFTLGVLGSITVLRGRLGGRAG